MKKLVLLATCCAGLSACDMPAFNLSVPSLNGTKSETAAVVTRDQVTLAGPRGFCIDPQSSIRGAVSSFIVFGNCAAITRSSSAPQPFANAIVTSTVQRADPALPKINTSSQQLSRFFESDVGQILISRTNDPRTVDVIESGVNSNGAFFLYVKDTSDGAPEGTENTYWRAYLDAKSSVVTVSVLSLDANPLTREEGLNILRDFTIAIQSIPSNSVTQDAGTIAPNAQPRQAGDIITPVARPNADTKTEPKKTRAGFLDRLFG